MVIIVSKKNIHRYKYTKRKIRLKGKGVKKTEGLISVSDVDISIANAIRKLN
jgi:hypothetical protein